LRQCSAGITRADRRAAFLAAVSGHTCSVSRRHACDWAKSSLQITLHRLPFAGETQCKMLLVHTLMIDRVADRPGFRQAYSDYDKSDDHLIEEGRPLATVHECGGSK